MASVARLGPGGGVRRYASVAASVRLVHRDYLSERRRAAHKSLIVRPTPYALLTRHSHFNFVLNILYIRDHDYDHLLFLGSH